MFLGHKLGPCPFVDNATTIH